MYKVFILGYNLSASLLYYSYSFNKFFIFHKKDRSRDLSFLYLTIFIYFSNSSSLSFSKSKTSSYVFLARFNTFSNASSVFNPLDFNLYILKIINSHIKNPLTLFYTTFRVSYIKIYS